MWLRSSITYHGDFNLVMGRSPGFGPTLTDYGTYHTRSPCGSGPQVLNLACKRSSPDRSTKSTPLHVQIVLRQFVGTGFQVLFHSPPGVLFTFPSQYFFAIAHWVVFRLGGWSPHLHTGFLVSRTTPDTTVHVCISHTRLSLSAVCLPIQFCYAFM